MDSLQLLTLYLALTPIFSGRKAKINLHTAPKLTVVIPISCLLPCEDPGIIFVRGPHVNLTKKALTALFVCFWFFLSPQLILQKSNGYFQRKISFFKVPEGVLIFPGGRVGGGGGRWVGSNCLFPIETQITSDFPGGVRTPCPPLDPHLAEIYLVSQSAK